MNPGTEDFISSMFSESCVWLKKKGSKKKAAPPPNLAMHFQQFPGISFFDECPPRERDIVTYVTMEIDSASGESERSYLSHANIAMLMFEAEETVPGSLRGTMDLKNPL